MSAEREMLSFCLVVWEISGIQALWIRVDSFAPWTLDLAGRAPLIHGGTGCAGLVPWMMFGRWPGSMGDVRAWAGYRG